MFVVLLSSPGSHRAAMIESKQINELRPARAVIILWLRRNLTIRSRERTELPGLSDLNVRGDAYTGTGERIRPRSRKFHGISEPRRLERRIAFAFAEDVGRRFLSKF